VPPIVPPLVRVAPPDHLAAVEVGPEEAKGDGIRLQLRLLRRAGLQLLLRQGAADGFLAPYKVVEVHIDRDDAHITCPHPSEPIRRERGGTLVRSDGADTKPPDCKGS